MKSNNNTYKLSEYDNGNALAHFYNDQPVRRNCLLLRRVMHIGKSFDGNARASLPKQENVTFVPKSIRCNEMRFVPHETFRENLSPSRAKAHLTFYAKCTIGETDLILKKHIQKIKYTLLSSRR